MPGDNLQTDLDLCFAVNEQDVISASIHGDTLILNLNSGAYYTAEGAGGLIWACLSSGMSARQVVDRLTSLYPDAAQAIVGDVIAFIAELQQENLLEDGPAGQGNGEPPELPADGPAGYQKPTLEKYTDFEVLLMLDPIHQVHEVKGWPTPKSS